MNQNPSVIDHDVTWNNAGLTYKAIRVYVRNTNSAAGSMLIDVGVKTDATTETRKFGVTKDGGATLAGSLTAHAATAVPAGGTAGAGLLFSATANLGVFFGSGAPTLTAAKGSLYLRTDGSGVANRAYINTDGAGTWTAISTAA